MKVRQHTFKFTAAIIGTLVLASCATAYEPIIPRQPFASFKKSALRVHNDFGLIFPLDTWELSVTFGMDDSNKTKLWTDFQFKSHVKNSVLTAHRFKVRMLDLVNPQRVYSFQRVRSQEKLQLQMLPEDTATLVNLTLTNYVGYTLGYTYQTFSNEKPAKRYKV